MRIILHCRTKLFAMNLKLLTPPCPPSARHLKKFVSKPKIYFYHEGSKTQRLLFKLFLLVYWGRCGKKPGFETHSKKGEWTDMIIFKNTSF